MKKKCLKTSATEPLCRTDDNSTKQAGFYIASHFLNEKTVLGAYYATGLGHLHFGNNVRTLLICKFLGDQRGWNLTELRCVLFLFQANWNWFENFILTLTLKSLQKC